MNSFDEVFEHVKRYCLEKGQIPEVAVKLWIDALHPVDLSGTDAVFTIQSDFQRSVILSNYEPLLKEAFRNILGFDVNLVIRIEEEFEPFQFVFGKIQINQARQRAGIGTHYA